MTREISAAPLAALEPRVHAQLARVASWSVVGSLVYAGCQWSMFVVLAKLGSGEMLGRLGLGFAVAAPVFLLTNLSLREILATDARGEHSPGHHLALRLVTSGIGLLAVAAIVALVDYRGAARVAILAVGVLKAIESVSDLLYGLMQRHERTDLIAGSVVRRGLGAVLALAVGVHLSGDLVWGLALVAFTWGLVLAVHDLPQSRRLRAGDLRPRWARADLAGLARLSLPLGVTAALISLATTVPRYFVERHRGEHDLGAFVALAYLMVIGLTVANAIGQAASPRLAAYHAAGDRARAGRLLLVLSALAAGLGLVGLVLARAWGRELLTVLYRPEYAAHAGAFEVLMIAAALGYVATILGHGMTAARSFRIQIPIFAAVAVVSLGAAAMLVPAYGVMGAAQASVVAALVNLLGAGAVNLYTLRRLSAAEVKPWS
jgi:O-antigen/teichoic acid export membrane protein